MFKDLGQALDFYEVNRRFFTDNTDAVDSLLMYMTLLRKTANLAMKAEKP